MSNLTNLFRLGRSVKNYGKLLSQKRRRNVCTTSVRRKSLEETVGLPPKPKRPLTPYFRFLKQIRPVLVEQNPKASVIDITKLVAQHWEKIESKAKLQLEEEYKKDQEKYATEKLKYESQLTDSDRQKLTEARRDKENRKKRKVKRDKCREFQKPKKAPSPFVLWMMSQFQNRGTEPFRKFQLKAAEQWKNMSEAERQPFVDRSKELSTKYKEDLALWEEKMIRLGNIDIIRNESLINQSIKGQRKTRTKSATRQQ